MKRIKRIIAVLLLIIAALLLSYMVHTYKIVASVDVSEIVKIIGGEGYG